MFVVKYIRAKLRSRTIPVIIVSLLLTALAYLYGNKGRYEMEITAVNTAAIITNSAENADNIHMTIREDHIAASGNVSATKILTNATLEQEASSIHTRAMALLSKYPRITNIVDGMFLLLEPIRYTEKYDVIMAAFDELVLDLWDYYQPNGNSSERGDRRRSWQTDDERQLLINCYNIQALRPERILGAGHIKTAYLADFNGFSVVVKVKNMKVINGGKYSKNNFKNCVEDDVRILNELILFGRLHHPMFNKLLGFCVHSGFAVPRITTLPGAVAVYEVGQHIHNWGDEFNTTFNETLRHTMAFADFFDYAEHSPFGRLTVIDLHRAQFVRVGPHYTLTDMDVVHNKEDPQCSDVKTIDKLHKGQLTKMCVSDSSLSAGLSIEIACVHGTCMNYAQQHNMNGINRIFFKRIFKFANIPSELQMDLLGAQISIENYIPAARLYDDIKTILDNYMYLKTIK